MLRECKCKSTVCVGQSKRECLFLKEREGERETVCVSERSRTKKKWRVCGSFVEGFEN